jgi:hypothetical protein
MDYLAVGGQAWHCGIWMSNHGPAHDVSELSSDGLGQFGHAC